MPGESIIAKKSLGVLMHPTCIPGGRVNGTFGENAEINARLTAAYIIGLQGDSLDKSSVAAMVKHFPGSGPVDGGKDSHFPPGLQSYKGNNFRS